MQDATDERTRRLESDAQAVQVLTIHRAKGLEFPVVYCPDLWDPSPVTKSGRPVDFHDPDDADRRKVDVGGGSAYRAHWHQHRDETRGEDLRLAYVALTRAKHQAVAWWVPTKGSKDSALGRLVFARGDDGAIPAEGRSVPDDTTRWRASSRSPRAPGCVGVEEARLGMLGVVAAVRSARRARRGGVGARRRPPVATHLLQRPLGRHPRRARGQRARGAGRRRRAGGAVGGRDRRAARPDLRGAVAAGRHAGRPRHRHARAPRLRDDRLRRRRPARRGGRARRRGAGVAASRHRRAREGRRRAGGGDRDAARRRLRAARPRPRRPPRRARVRAAAGRRRRRRPAR